ncbi:MAG: hypothetical protein JNM93_07490 [Bacteriovoracaceae bacterium]|nr:hypothetical protein [Bacteriovoracaceae bacterium]
MVRSCLVFILVCLTSCALLEQTQPKRRSSFGTSANPYPKDKDYNNPVKKKIVLLPFFNESPFGGEDIAVVATEEFRREIMKTRDFVVESGGPTLIGNSKEIYSGGGVKLGQLARKARLTGLNLVVYGRIVKARVRQKTDEIGLVRKTKSFADSELELRIFDVHSNKEIYNGRENGDISDDTMRFYLDENESNLNYRQDILRYSVRVAVRRFISKVVEVGDKMDWTGRVAKILSNKIYLNAGRESGINIGDILKVITEGTEIYDPETGALIGMSKGHVKGTLEVVDFFGPDGAIAILHSGGTVTEGDFVQLY